MGVDGQGLPRGAELRAWRSSRHERALGVLWTVHGYKAGQSPPLMLSAMSPTPIMNTPAIMQTWTAMIRCRWLPLLEPDQVCKAAQHRRKAKGEPGDEQEGARVP